MRAFEQAACARCLIKGLGMSVSVRENQSHAFAVLMQDVVDM